MREKDEEGIFGAIARGTGHDKRAGTPSQLCGSTTLHPITGKNHDGETVTLCHECAGMEE